MKNLGSRLSLSLIVVAITFSSGLLSLTATATETGEIENILAIYKAKGSNVLHLSSKDGSLFSGQNCEALSSVPGVVIAGGRVSSQTVKTSTVGIPELGVTFGTPSYGYLVWPALAFGEIRPGAIIDRGAAPGLERREASYVTTALASFEFAVADMGESRLPYLANHAFVPTVADQPVSECLVEYEDGYGAGVSEVLPNHLGGAAEIVVTSIFVPDPAVPSPEAMFAGRTSSTVALISGVAIAMACVGVWAIRRNEFGLYRQYQMRPSQIALMLTTEFALLALVPLNAGAVTALYMAEGQIYGLALHASILDYLRVAALSSISIPLMTLWLERTAVSRILLN